jgi:hypothetical protein
VFVPYQVIKRAPEKRSKGDIKLISTWIKTTPIFQSLQMKASSVENFSQGIRHEVFQTCRDDR